MSDITEVKNPLFDRFTVNARKVISTSYNLARKYNSKELKLIHVFLALLEEKHNIVEEIFEKIGVDIDSTRSSIQEKLIFDSKKEKVRAEVDKPKFSSEVKNLINLAFKISSELNHVYVGSEHLLLAIFKSDADFLMQAKGVGLTYNAIEEVLSKLASRGDQDLFQGEEEGDEELDMDYDLPFFCRDMNNLANKGKFSVVTGRDDEINRLVHVLSRKTKNNPLLVGEAGVGKTAIVEGFTSRLVEGKLPASFKNKRIWNLDISSILSGARLRGDVEERIQSVIDQVLEDGNIILFIDEIHTIVGAGSVGGKDSMDIANILKPHLTDSDISIIGATTHDEYNKYFENDSALARRFQSITVDELTEESAVEVIKQLKPEFEKYHKISIKEDALEAAVKLSKKYIQDRYLPDKAIDIIDEAGASLKIGREVAIQPEISELGEKLVKIQNEKEEAIEKGKLDEAKSLKEKESKVIKEIEDVVEGKKKVTKKYSKNLTEKIVKETIVSMTKIPIVASDISNKRLKDLGPQLSKKVVGQDHVVENVAVAIQRSHLGLTESSRPLASFLFLGPTGVGKTKLAKSIAKELFGSEDLIYQIDMSEFMEMHSSAKLIGSPPGYVGYQEGGQLTTFVRRKPYAVILFDEIEKAHPDTLNLMLQLLEEGQLTDGQGRNVSFRNTIIIMTSNIGAEKVSNDKTLGFNISLDEESMLSKAYEEMKEKIMEELRYTLRPELINRIDLIDIFKGINKEDSLNITKLEVDNLKVQLLENSNILLDISTEVEEKVNDEGYSKEYGGRNIRRKVQELIENGLAQFLLKEDIKRKKGQLLKVSVDIKDDEIDFKLNDVK